MSASLLRAQPVGCGAGVAAVLAGAWRDPPPLPPPAPLAGVVPALEKSGAGGLVWWRLGRAAFPPPARLRALRDHYRHNVLSVAAHEADLRSLTVLLRGVGVESILVKGWSVARLYPDPGLRPCGDIDLCVRPDQLPATVEALRVAGLAHGGVDLHAGVADLDDRTWDEVVRRSRLVPLGGTDIRVLGAEDQLRHLCLHLLRHGAWRPLWLCDVAVVLESLPAGFDWDYCLAGPGRLSQWVLCALGLACRLLGARLDDPAVARRAERLPQWLPETVLSLWGGRRPGRFLPLGACLRHPLGPWRFLRDRWRRNPVEILFNSGSGPFYHLPPTAVRCVAFLLRARGYAVRQLRPPPVPLYSRAALPFDVHPARAA